MGGTVGGVVALASLLAFLKYSSSGRKTSNQQLPQETEQLEMRSRPEFEQTQILEADGVHRNHHPRQIDGASVKELPGLPAPELPSREIQL